MPGGAFDNDLVVEVKVEDAKGGRGVRVQEVQWGISMGGRVLFHGIGW